MPETTNLSKLNFDDLWDYNQPAATEERFRALLPHFVDDSARHTELLTQIARTQGLQRHFDEAHATLDAAQAQLVDRRGCAQIRYWLERGRVFNSAGKADEARPLFLAAWEVAQQTGEAFHAIDAAHMLAIIEAPAEQKRWNRLALDLTEQSTDPRAKKWLGSLNNNLGWSYFDEGDYRTALDYFHKALAAREIQGDDSSIRVARWCVAKALRMVGRVDEALANQEALLAINQQLGRAIAS